MWRNGLAHTAIHNTVTVDGLDQMKMLTRFTWTDWSHGRVLHHAEKKWQAEHDGYQRLPDPVKHRRTVLVLDHDRWLVIDHLTANKSHQYAVHWLLCDGDYGIQDPALGSGLWLKPAGGKPSDSKIIVQMGLMNGSASFSIVRSDPNSTRGWRSRYYGEKEPAISVKFETHQPQTTFRTVFGFEGDAIQLNGSILKVNSQELDLTQINK
jgi:hypothetical protein